MDIKWQEILIIHKSRWHYKMIYLYALSLLVVFASVSASTPATCLMTLYCDIPLIVSTGVVYYH